VGSHQARPSPTLARAFPRHTPRCPLQSTPQLAPPAAGKPELANAHGKTCACLQLRICSLSCNNTHLVSLSLICVQRTLFRMKTVDRQLAWLVAPRANGKTVGILRHPSNETTSQRRVQAGPMVACGGTGAKRGGLVGVESLGSSSLLRNSKARPWVTGGNPCGASHRGGPFASAPLPPSVPAVLPAERGLSVDPWVQFTDG
jgi:hypothetical protein